MCPVHVAALMTMLNRVRGDAIQLGRQDVHKLADDAGGGMFFSESLIQRLAEGGDCTYEHGFGMLYSNISLINTLVFPDELGTVPPLSIQTLA